MGAISRPNGGLPRIWIFQKNIKYVSYLAMSRFFYCQRQEQESNEKSKNIPFENIGHKMTSALQITELFEFRYLHETFLFYRIPNDEDNNHHVIEELWLVCGSNCLLFPQNIFIQR